MGDNTATFEALTRLPKRWQAANLASRTNIDGSGSAGRVVLHHLPGVKHDRTTRDTDALALLEAALRNISS